MSKKTKLTLVLQFADPRLQKQLSKNRLKEAVQAALFAPAEITLRFVNAEECRILNRNYRRKDYATNVLTFPYNSPEDEVNDRVITHADIILCTDVLQQEATDQHKSLLDHTLHLIVHGVLHAQGYDHEEEEEAIEMERLEVEILAKLGVRNPYREKN